MSGPQGPREHVKFGTQRPAKPKIRLSVRPKEGGSKTWVVLGILVGIGLVGYLAMSWARQPDPHYLKARDLVHDYQTGRPDESRNYNNPIYQQALDQLDLVDPDSISAVPARELRDEIASRRQAFLARVQTAGRDKNRVNEKRRLRKQRNLENHRRQLANPVTDYPECEHEEADGHDDH